MRLIDADALIDRTDDRYSLHEIGRRERDDIVNALEYAPTIEPERKKGKWIVKKLKSDDDYRYAICDQCGQIEGWDENVGMLCALMGEKYAHYCPNCGADMQKGDKDED